MLTEGDIATHVHFYRAPLGFVLSEPWRCECGSWSEFGHGWARIYAANGRLEYARG